MILTRQQALAGLGVEYSGRVDPRVTEVYADRIAPRRLRGLGDTSLVQTPVIDPNGDITADSLQLALTAGVTAYDTQIVKSNLTPWLVVGALILLFSSPRA